MNAPEKKAKPWLLIAGAGLGCLVLGCIGTIVAGGFAAYLGEARRAEAGETEAPADEWPQWDAGVVDPETVPASAPGWLATPGGASGERVPQGAPQVRDPAALWREGQAAEFTRRDDALLVCLITIEDRAWDSRGIFGRFRRADPTVSIEVDSRLHVRAFGEEDTHVLHVSAPVVNLTTESTLEVSAVDRDIGRADLIGHVVLTPGGRFPVRGTDEGLTVDCVVLPEAVARERVTAAVTEAQRTVARAAPEMLGAAREGRLTPTAMRPIQVAVREAAALAGWADPRVRVIVGEVNVLRRQLSAIASERFDAEQQRALSVGQAASLSSGGSLRFDAGGCGEDVPPVVAARHATASCGFVFTVERPHGRRVRPPVLLARDGERTPLGRMQVRETAPRGGARSEAYFVAGPHPDGARLLVFDVRAPGEAETVTFRFDATPPVSTPPVSPDDPQ